MAICTVLTVVPASFPFCDALADCMNSYELATNSPKLKTVTNCHENVLDLAYSQLLAFS